MSRIEDLIPSDNIVAGRLTYLTVQSEKI